MAKKQNFTTDSRQNMRNYLGILNKNLYTTSEGSPVEFEEIAPIKLQTQPLNTIEFDDVQDQSKQQGISISSVGTEPTSKDDNREVAEDEPSWKDAVFSLIESIWGDDVKRNLGAINLNNQEIDKLSGLMSDTPDNPTIIEKCQI